MKKVSIQAGSCGAIIEAEAEAVDDRYVNIRITKCCEHIEKMRPVLEGEPIDAFATLAPLGSSVVYKSGIKCIPHSSCVVPSGLHKLIEAEMGLSTDAYTAVKFVE